MRLVATIAATLLVAGALAVGAFAVYSTGAISGQSTSLRDEVEARPDSGAAVAFERAGVRASRVCVFGPYSTATAISEELGFTWTDAERTGISGTDTHVLVVAADDRRVVAWAMVNRAAGTRLIAGQTGCHAT